MNHHDYVVSATLVNDCHVFDIAGERLLHERGDGLTVSRIVLDLDRGVYHQNFNVEKRDRLLEERSHGVVQEKWLDREQRFLLRAKRPGASARKLAEEYGLEELRDYIDRSRSQIDKMRGRPLGERSIESAETR